MKGVYTLTDLANAVGLRTDGLQINVSSNCRITLEGSNFKVRMNGETWVVGAKQIVDYTKYLINNEKYGVDYDTH